MDTVPLLFCDSVAVLIKRLPFLPSTCWNAAFSAQGDRRQVFALQFALGDDNKFKYRFVDERRHSLKTLAEVKNMNPKTVQIHEISVEETAFYKRERDSFFNVEDLGALVDIVKPLTNHPMLCIYVVSCDMRLWSAFDTLDFGGYNYKGRY